MDTDIEAKPMINSKEGSGQAGNSWLERNVKFILVAPGIAFLLLVGIFPLLFSLYLVFNSWQPGTGEIVFVGLQNLKTLFEDGRFWHAFQVTVIFVVMAVGLELILGFIVALLMQTQIRGREWFRVMFTLPLLLTPIAVAFTWRMIFDFTRGPFNFFLGLLGIPGVMWLGNPQMALFSVVLVDIWQWTPFVALALLAALESQDVEIYEAAVVDGASFWEMLRYVTLPLLRPFILAVVLLRSIDAFKIFDIPFVLTGGGPGTATEVITLYAYVAQFRTFNMGYMSTMAWVLVIIMAIIFLFFVRMFRRMGTV